MARVVPPGSRLHPVACEGDTGRPTRTVAGTRERSSHGEDNFEGKAAKGAARTPILRPVRRFRPISSSQATNPIFAQGEELPTEKLHRIMTCSDEDLADEISRLNDEMSGLDQNQILSLAGARASWESYDDEDRDVTEHP
jgi:hypothetical protein